MIDEQDLREQLKGADVPPTGLTTTGLVGAGRRRAARRRTLQAGCGVALAATLAVAVPSFVTRAAGQATNAADGDPRVVQCAATSLPLPDGLREPQAEAIDPSGKYILGNVVTRSGQLNSEKGDASDLRPVLWTDGQPQALELIGASVRASAVNAQGTVVGVAGHGDGNGRWDSVIRYTGGVPEKLTAPPGTWRFSPLVKIDPSGTVLAVAYRNNDPEVLIWKAGSATATQLPLPAGIESLNVTDAGTVIADVNTKSKHTVHVWDQQGNDRQLGTPTADGAYNFSARGDWVTANLGSSGTVVRWNLPTGELTDTGVGAPANGGNARGWIIAGQTLQRDDATVELAGVAGLTATPRAVSDTGVVVGSVYAYGTGTDPAPQPSASSGPGEAGSLLYSWNCGK